MKKYLSFVVIVICSCFFLNGQDKIGINKAVPEFNFDIRSTNIASEVELH